MSDEKKQPDKDFQLVVGLIVLAFIVGMTGGVILQGQVCKNTYEPLLETIDNIRVDTVIMDFNETLLIQEAKKEIEKEATR